MSSFNSRPQGSGRPRHGLDAVLGALRTLFSSMTEERTSGVSHGNAFEAAVRAPEDMLGELTRHAIRLTPLVKRRLFDGFDGVPETLRLGWRSCPAAVPDRSRSACSWIVGGSARSRSPTRRGRVFVGDDPTMDTHGMETRFMFSREEEVPLPAASGRSRGRGQGHPRRRGRT